MNHCKHTIINLGSKIVLAVLLISLPWLCFPPPSRGESKSTKELIEGAKKEGEVVFYSSMNMADTSIMLGRFEKKYPFLKAKTLRVDSGDLISKIMMEYRLKKYAADAISTVAFHMYVMRKEGILGQYVPADNSLYPREGKEEGYWISPYCNPYVVAYNTKLVKREQLPKTYEDLLHPQWRGKMMMEPSKVEWFVGMLQVMGRDKGLKFMRELARQNIAPRIGHTLISGLIAAGEGELQINVPAGGIDRLRAKGAPLDWVALGPVPGVMTGIGIAAKPPHPNAARLWVDFVLSRESQEFLRDQGRTSIRPDVVQPASTKDLKLIYVNPALADNLTEETKLLRNIFSTRK